MVVDGFVINGGNKLSGDVKISGAKNAALPILAATLIAKGEYILNNVPELKDIRTMIQLLEKLGLEITKLKNNTYKIINNGNLNTEAKYDLVKTMRASFLVMGPLLAHFQESRVSLPGGCAIGARPVNYHLKGFEALGCKINIEHGYVEAKADKLIGNSIYLDFPSVGATENIIMAATLAEGKTIIENAAQEPEIEDLCGFLNSMGAKITGIGTARLEIEGVSKLIPGEYTIIPDRIEAGTFIVASIITDSEINITDINLKHLESFNLKLEEMGVVFEKTENSIKVKSKLKDLKPTKVKTMPYPGYPTDLQAQITILLSIIEGTSEIKETIFENRFMHISELNRMGTDITIDGNTALIKGVKSLSGAEVMASDLRAGACLVLAALIAKGETTINRIYHIDRGYEKMEEKLVNIGADIKRVKLGVM